ncbi:MAG: ABC-type transport auxiliary lipoprotein family protein [Sphingomonadaceae bacterium]
MSKASLPLFAALLLGGCLSFGSDPPPELMTLTAQSGVSEQTTRSAPTSEAITVLTPSVAQTLRTVRVPVQIDATSVAYLKDAQWVEQPAILFGRLLAEVAAAETGRVVLDENQFVLDPGLRISGQLHRFGLDAATLEVVALYDAGFERDGVIRTRRFEARVPVAAAEAQLVAPALNEAANRVALEVARWIAMQGQ